MSAENRTNKIDAVKLMEKKQTYEAPAVREWAVRFDASFLQSTSGPIGDWGDDDDPIHF